jgi:hemerythrin
MKITGIIRKFREDAGLSADTAAKDTGIPLELYKKYEAGDPGISIDHLYRIASRFEVDVKALLVGKDSKLAVICQAGKGADVDPNPNPEYLTEDPGPAGNPPEPKKIIPAPEPEKASPAAAPDLPKNNRDAGNDAAEKKQAGGPKPGRGSGAAAEVKHDNGPRPVHRQAFRNDEIIIPRKRIIEWQRPLSTGVGFFDERQKKFTGMINDLYAASLTGWENSKVALMNIIRYTLDSYWRDLKNEETIMERVGYPDYKAHKKEHVFLLKQILERAAEFQTGKKTDVKDFVVVLKNWVFMHVGVTDKNMSLYLKKLKKEGALNRIIIRVKTDANQRLIVK